MQQMRDLTASIRGHSVPWGGLRRLEGSLESLLRFGSQEAAQKRVVTMHGFQRTRLDFVVALGPRSYYSYQGRTGVDDQGLVLNFV